MSANPCVQAEVPIGRFRLASPRIAVVLGGLFVVLLAAFAVLLLLAHEFGQFGPPFVIAAPCGMVGFLIAWRQPANPIGWLLLASMAAAAFSIDCGYYAWLVYGLGHRGLPLGWLAMLLGQFGILAFAAFPPVILLFPDGRVPSRRWRRALKVYVGLGLVAVVGRLALGTSALIEHRVNAQTVSSRGGNGLINQPASTSWLSFGSTAFVLAIVVMLVASVLHQVFGYRRSTDLRREQVKVLLVGGMVCALAVVALASGTANGGSSLAAEAWGVIPWIAFSALPISISVAIFRYRLYEIDRLISRTLSYLIITGLLAGVFVGIVVFATRVLPFSSPVAVAASTLAAAALFNPLRIRTQRLVDRRFNRARYDAEAIVAAFRMRLRESADLETVHGELLAAVGNAVQPAHTVLWIRPQPPPSHA